MTIDADKIENLITPNTSAILGVHVYGFPCNVKKIDEIAKKHNLKVIYDAAHAFSTEIDEVGIGNFGDITMFSFHATKLFNTIEGGCLTYKDEALVKKIYNLRNFGIQSEEVVEDIGINGKMNEFQAAWGLLNLKQYREEQERRKAIKEIYDNGLKTNQFILSYKRYDKFDVEKSNNSCIITASMKDKLSDSGIIAILICDKLRLHERLNNSKNIILFLSANTVNSRALREEIDYGINNCGLPIIVVYPDYKNKSR